MLRFILKRLGHGALTLGVLVTLTFFVIRLAPGGPFSKSRKLSAEVLANIERAYHLDEPLYMQFGRYVWGILRLDFGPSTRFRDYDVGAILASGLPYSLTIGLWAVLLASVVGVSLGIAGALRRNSHGERAETRLEQRVHEPRRACTDVNERFAGFQMRSDEIERRRRCRFEPCQFIFRARAVDLVPVILSTCHLGSNLPLSPSLIHQRH